MNNKFNYYLVVGGRRRTVANSLKVAPEIFVMPTFLTVLFSKALKGLKSTFLESLFSCCQRKVKMSYSLQSNNVSFYFVSATSGLPI